MQTNVAAHLHAGQPADHAAFNGAGFRGRGGGGFGGPDGGGFAGRGIDR